MMSEWRTKTFLYIWIFCNFNIYGSKLQQKGVRNITTLWSIVVAISVIICADKKKVPSQLYISLFIGF